jgi:hypothetical protein
MQEQLSARQKNLLRVIVLAVILMLLAMFGVLRWDAAVVH